MASQTLTATTAVPKVNLLPREVSEKQRARTVQVGLGAAVAAAVGVVGFLYLSASGSVSDAKSDLQRAQQENTRLTNERAKLNNVSKAFTDLATAETLLRTAMGGEIRWSQYLTDLSLTIPDNVWVDSFVVTTTNPAAAQPATAGLVPTGIGNVKISGSALSHDDVAVWLETLAKQKGYTFAFFTNSARKDPSPSARETVKFDSSVTITEAALSQRYLKPARI